MRLNGSRVYISLQLRFVITFSISGCDANVVRIAVYNCDFFFFLVPLLKVVSVDVGFKFHRLSPLNEFQVSFKVFVIVVRWEMKFSFKFLENIFCNYFVVGFCFCY